MIDAIGPLPRRSGGILAPWPAGFSRVFQRRGLAPIVTAFALLPPAVVPPVAFVLFPALPTRFESRALAAALLLLLLLLLLLPAGAAVAAARIGRRRIMLSRHRGNEGDLKFGVIRLDAWLALFAYAVALTPTDAGHASETVTIAAAGLVLGWFLFLLALGRRGQSAFVRFGAIAADALLLSAFLHFGGGSGAAALPLYLLLVLVSGWQFGLAALAQAAGFGIGGFAAVIATTGFWQDRPALAAGVLALLAIGAAGAARLLRALAGLRRSASRATLARSAALAAAVATLRRALAEGDVASMPLQEFRGELQDACDLISIVTGGLSTTTEPFDLHAVVQGVLPLLRRAADRRAVRFRLRIDPAVPWSLHGSPRLVARILHNLGMIAIEGGGGRLRLSVDDFGAGERAVQLRLRLSDVRAPDRTAPRGAVIEHLLRPVGGKLETAGVDGTPLSILLPLRLGPIVPGSLDLAGRSVLIVTEDGQFAGACADPMNQWRADVRWIGGCGAASDWLDGLEATVLPVLIVDARTAPLAALSFVHRCATSASPTASLVMIAAPDDADRIDDLAGDVCEAVLRSSDAVALLGNVLHALPPNESLPRSVAPEAAPSKTVEPEARSRIGEDRVTPITVHPRFLAEPTAIIEAGTIASLDALAGGDDFLAELAQAFRDDARRLMERIGRSVAAADAAQFQAALTALRRCAGNLGGSRLCGLVEAMCDAGSEELRHDGADLVQRLTAELGRFEAALADLVDGPQLRRN